MFFTLYAISFLLVSCLYPQKWACHFCINRLSLPVINHSKTNCWIVLELLGGGMNSQFISCHKFYRHQLEWFKCISQKMRFPLNKNKFIFERSFFWKIIVATIPCDYSWVRLIYRLKCYRKAKFKILFF